MRDHQSEFTCCFVVTHKCKPIAVGRKTKWTVDTRFEPDRVRAGPGKAVKNAGSVLFFTREVKKVSVARERDAGVLHIVWRNGDCGSRSRSVCDDEVLFPFLFFRMDQPFAVRRNRG